MASIAEDIATDNIAFTTFGGMKAVQGKPGGRSWSGLIALFQAPPVRGDIDSLPFISFADWPGNSRRHGNTPTGYRAIIGDHDAGTMSLEEARERLQVAGVRALIHTTRKHTPQAPRLRIVAPLSATVGPEQFLALADLLNGALGGAMARESWDLTRCYFYGRVEGGEYACEAVEGTCLDVLDMCGADWEPIGKPMAAKEGKPPSTKPADLDIEMLAKVSEVTAQTMGDLRSALRGLSPARIDDRGGWVDVLMALASLKGTEWEDEARTLAEETSARSPKFDPDDFPSRWEGFSPLARTYKSIFQWAKEDTGWRPLPPVVNAKALGGQEKQSRFRVVREEEFRQLPAQTWIVKRVLPKAEMAMVYGASGSGKSFFVLDLAAAIQLGKEWCGCKVQQGQVVYIAAEGAMGVRKRIAAYRQAHGLASLPLGLIEVAPNLRSSVDAEEVSQQIKLAFGEVSLIIIDTLARVSPGAEENTGKDMGLVLEYAAQIGAEAGAMVLIVHHCGKDQDKGARGWSGLKAAMDVEIEVNRLEDARSATVTKMKDGEEGHSFGFSLEPVLLGFDEDGDEITSCVIQHNGGGKVQREKAGGVGAHQRAVLKAFEELEALGGEVEVEGLLARAAESLPESVESRRRKPLAKRAFDALVKGAKLVSTPHGGVKRA